MDGLKKRLNDSLRLKLSFVLSLAILAVALVAGVFSFVSALDEAHELQDDTLRQVAALFDRQLPLPHLGDEGRAKGSDEESRVIVQYLAGGNGAAGGAGAAGSAGAALPLPATLPDGLHVIEAGGEPFRVLVKTTAGGERIAVAQETGVRDEIARDSALRTLMPFLILVPILLLIVADLVRKMFRPIAALSAEIDGRDEHALHAVREERLPIEVRPFAVAINRLLARVDQSMAGQRRFVADAAHELRSPLTALSLQAGRLGEAEMSAQARERLGTLQLGLERSRNLLEQLLALARAQAPPAAPAVPLAVAEIYRRVLEDLMPLAQARNIDIGVEGGPDVRLNIGEADLLALVRNLADNAIRYTPAGGRVDLSAGDGAQGAVLQVSDSGPGIPPAEHARVFDPFYRAPGSGQPGSGLGLSIVKAIADRIGAQVTLSYADAARQTGLCVRVQLPANSLAQDI